MNKPSVQAARPGVRRWTTHPVTPAVGVAIIATALAAVLGAGGAKPAVVMGWVLLPLAAGYAISGSP